MATAKKTPQSEAIEKLSGDVENLKADIGALMIALKDAGVAETKSAAHTAEAHADALKAQVADVTELAHASVNGATVKAQKIMKDQPLVAMLAAAAAGLAVGLATAKK